MNKVIITGGHHNSALVIARALKAKGFNITWVGHRRTMIADPHDSLEYQEVTNADLPFINLYAGKFHSRAHPLFLLRIPLGFIQSLFIILKVRPRLLLNFGGYLSAPISLVAWIFGIPIITFEQTTSIGRANSLICKFSRHNFLAWESSLKYFPVQKTTVVGLPLDPQLLSKSSSKKKPSTILITGGKQGSHIINQVVFKIIPQLTKIAPVIHLTGFSRHTKDYEQALKFKSRRYRPYSHLLTKDMINVLKNSRLVIGRSGAHTIYELLVLNIPAILIPLPFSYHDEQLQNAKLLKSAGLATIINQQDLNPVKLLKAIGKINEKKSKPQISPSLDATEKILNYISKNYPNAQKEKT